MSGRSMRCRRLKTLFRGLAAGALLAILMVVHVSDVHANLIVNGDFSLEVPSNGTGNGWTSSGTNVFWTPNAGNPSPSFVLNESGELLSDPRIEQTVAGLTIGLTYRLAGERLSFAPGFGDPNALGFGVFLDEGPILELARGNTDLIWEAFSVEFIATSTSHTIAFVAERDGDDSSYHIDNIDLVVVPEPSTLTLLGFGAMLFRITRHRHPA